MISFSSVYGSLRRLVSNYTKTVHIFLEEHFEMWLETIKKELETIYRYSLLFGLPIPLNRDELIRKRIELHTRYMQQVRNRIEKIDPDKSYIYQEMISIRFPEAGSEKYKEVLEKLIYETPQKFPYMLFTQIGIPLLQNGATLLGVEDDQLMDEKITDTKETELTMSSLFGGETTYPASVAKRDQFIAKRITDTLPAGKTAILFIGGGHQTEKHFPVGITIHSHRDIYDWYNKEVRKLL